MADHAPHFKPEVTNPDEIEYPYIEKQARGFKVHMSKTVSLPGIYTRLFFAEQEIAKYQAKSREAEAKREAEKALKAEAEKAKEERLALEDKETKPTPTKKKTTTSKKKDNK